MMANILWSGVSNADGARLRLKVRRSSAPASMARFYHRSRRCILAWKLLDRTDVAFPYMSLLVFIRLV